MNRRNFQRNLGNLRYKKIFYIATEGIRTEPQYFNFLDTHQSHIKVTWVKGGNKSAPLQVLKRMKAHLLKNPLRAFDEAWIVIDKDNWNEDHLLQIRNWSLEKENYGFAISNPSFEYWLLLHFEDGTGLTTKDDCIRKLKQHLPEYDKNIKQNTFSKLMATQALERAKKRNFALDQNIYGTTVHRLVEKLL